MKEGHFFQGFHWILRCFLTSNGTGCCYYYYCYDGFFGKKCLFWTQRTKKWSNCWSALRLERLVVWRVNWKNLLCHSMNYDVVLGFVCDVDEVMIHLDADEIVAVYSMIDWDANAPLLHVVDAGSDDDELEGHHSFRIRLRFELKRSGQLLTKTQK